MFNIFDISERASLILLLTGNNREMSFTDFNETLHTCATLPLLM